MNFDDFNASNEDVRRQAWGEPADRRTVTDAIASAFGLDENQATALRRLTMFDGAEPWDLPLRTLLEGVIGTMSEDEHWDAAIADETYDG